MQQRKLNRWFWIALITPVVILLCILYKPVMTYFFGKSIVLTAIPVNPTDLFYGGYVDLHFQIEEADTKQVEEATKKKSNLVGEIPVYVMLTPSGKEYVIKKVTQTKPNEGIYLEAKLSPRGTDGKKYRLEYPIERYYVEKGTGWKLEEIAPTGNAHVFVKVKNGYAIITKVERSDLKQK